MNLCFIGMRITKHDAIGNHTLLLLEELSADKRNTLELCAFSIEAPVPDGVKSCALGKINKHSLKAELFSLSNSHKLAKKFAMCDALVVVCIEPVLLPSICLAKVINPHLKIVYIFHGITPVGFHDDTRTKFLESWRYFAYRALAKKADYVVTDSNYTRDIVKKEIKRDDISSIHIGIDQSRFKKVDCSDVVRKHGLSGKFVMLYVGRLASIKQIDLLIRSMTALPVDVMLLIAGGGDDGVRLENLTKTLGVDERVIFAGKVSDADLMKYYAASDVFVTASLHEGFCVPVVEAFASGKPVVVPNRTAMPEVAGDAGLVYDGSLEDFISKIQMLKNDKKFREQLSKKVASRAKEFNTDRILDYVKFLENICEC